MSKRSKKPLAIIDLDVRDDLEKLRSAGQLLRQTWRRNAIYQFLNTVYAVHCSWRIQGKVRRRHSVLRRLTGEDAGKRHHQLRAGLVSPGNRRQLVQVGRA